MIALSAAGVGIAAAGVLAAYRGGGGRARVYLIILFGVFACLTSLPLTASFATGFFQFHLPLLLPLLLILPPLFFHYVAARIAEEGPPPIHWRDAVLPAMGLAAMLGFWFLPPEGRAMMFIDGEAPAGIIPAALAIAAFALVIAWPVVSSVYLVITLRRLGAFRAALKNFYSNTDKRELRWIDWLIAQLAALWGAAALSLFSDNLGSGLLFPGEVTFLLCLIFLLSLIAFASVAPVRENTQKSLPPADLDDAPKDKYARSALSADHARKLAQRIEKAMQEDALYLDPNLSLKKLSGHVGALPNLVSQTLNEQIGATFFDYVAHWRIEAAKPRISSGEASVLEVALEVGFNSRSTFYKAFKRETGRTPKAYRDESLYQQNEKPRP